MIDTGKSQFVFWRSPCLPEYMSGEKVKVSILSYQWSKLRSKRQTLREVAVAGPKSLIYTQGNT